MAEVQPLRRVVEVFADVVCPFTHVALLHVIAQRERVERDDVVFRLRAWPLERVNGEPQSPETLSEDVRELRAHVAPDRFQGFRAAMFPMTAVPALVLAEHAYRKDMCVGEQVSIALRRALFEEGRDVSRPDVLADLARRFGLDAPDAGEDASIEADHAEGRARGVEGSPHFFVDGESCFNPTLHVEQTDDGLVARFDPDGFDRLSRVCFGVPGQVPVR